MCNLSSELRDKLHLKINTSFSVHMCFLKSLSDNKKYLHYIEDIVAKFIISSKYFFARYYFFHIAEASSNARNTVQTKMLLQI